jgi:hypothetical protein
MVHTSFQRRSWQLWTRQFPIVNNTNMTATRICKASGTLELLSHWWNSVWNNAAFANELISQCKTHRRTVHSIFSCRIDWVKNKPQNRRQQNFVGTQVKKNAQLRKKHRHISIRPQFQRWRLGEVLVLYPSLANIEIRLRTAWVGSTLGRFFSLLLQVSPRTSSSFRGIKWPKSEAGLSPPSNPAYVLMELCSMRET